MLLRRIKHEEVLKSSDRNERFYAFLRAHPVGVLSTVTPNGDPHGVVIYFDISRDFVLSFLTRAETRKHDNLQHNNHVMITVFEPESQTTVQIVGEAADSHSVNSIAGAILGAAIKTTHAGLPPITKLRAGPLVGYKVVPRQVRMAVYARPDPGGYADLFESIESFEIHADKF